MQQQLDNKTLAQNEDDDGQSLAGITAAVTALCTAPAPPTDAERQAYADSKPPLKEGEVEEAPVTEEERQAMIDDVKQQTKSLCAMLDNYRQMENDLKDDVMEFVLRDVNEQNMHMGIARRVAAAQQQLLNDTRYVGWAMANSKGEFTPSFEKGGEMQQQPRDNKNLDPLKTWHHVAHTAAFGDDTDDNNNNNEQKKQTPPLPVLLPIASRVIPPRIALTLCHGHSSIDSTDQVVAEKQRQRFISFVDFVDGWRSAIATALGVGSDQLVPCVNGVPLVSPDAVLCKTHVEGIDFTVPPLEEKFSSLLAMWYTTCAAAPAAELFSIGSARNRKWFGSILKHGSNSSEIMSTSATSQGDTLSLVPLAALVSSSCSSPSEKMKKQPQCSSVLCYAIVSKGSVVAVEPVVPHVALHLLCGFANVVELRQKVDAALSRTVLKPLFERGVLSRGAMVLFSVSGGKGGNSAPPLLLDVCQLTPQMPTMHLTWKDVCSMLGGGGAENDGGQADIQFRGQKARVANMQAIEEETAEMQDDRPQACTSVAHSVVQQLEYVIHGKHLEEQRAVAAAAAEKAAAAKAATSSSTNNNIVKASVVAGAVAVGAFLLSRWWKSKSN